MSFGMFKYPNQSINEKIDIMTQRFQILTVDECEALASRLGKNIFPNHLMKFVKSFDGGGGKIAWYKSTETNQENDSERNDNVENIIRSRGFWDYFKRDKAKDCVHHFNVIYHGVSMNARLFYKYDCDDIKLLRFIENRTNQ